MDSLKNKRIEWIDYLKAFACFLVVLGHLLQSLLKSKIDNNMYITSYIIWFVYLFHMPLFMCVSGFLYCKKKKDFSWQNYKKFEIKKIINLSIPYFTFYLLFLGINILFSSSVNTPKGMNELIGIINNPMAPYWFLYALLSIFIIIPIVELLFRNNNKVIFIFLTILKIVSIFWNTKIYFIDAFMSWALYFYIGIFINVEKENDKNKGIINIILLTLYILLSLVYYNLKKYCIESILEIIDIFFAIAGIYVFINCFKNLNKSKILDTFKKYTFQIYLMHTIFAAGFRIVLLKLDITNYFIHFILGIIASIYIPVLISVISDKIKYTNIFFYPIKTIEELKERKELRWQKKN